MDGLAAKAQALPTDVVRRAPKVLLHDHLDGGLRPQTVIDLAAQVDHQLPSPAPDVPGDAQWLGDWFHDAASSGSLERYLETFAHTVGVLQTASGLHRVASECAQDLAADGVVYAEVRYAPEQHLEAGLSLPQVVEAVQAGFADGARAALASGASVAGRPIFIGTVLTAMRHAARSTEIAELAVANRDAGVVGFDIAGAEAGYPPSRHLDAFDYLHRKNFPVTIHAGEGFGLPSIWEAVQVCGADRLGHGVRIVDDIEGERLGALATWVRDKRIPLEMCPSSNVQTGVSPDVASHPISRLKDLRFRVTVNTDNRLMSRTSLTREMALLVAEAGWSLADLRWATVNAMKSAFVHFPQRLALIEDVIKPGYAVLEREAASAGRT